MNEQDYKKVLELMNEIEKVMLGKRHVVQMTVASLLAGGHILFEDVPGVGKTLLIKALAKAIAGNFSRIQFTPDLLPSDILGVSIFNKKTNEFEFRKGPIFTNILLADEINRTTPRTQAALLEAMSEGSVTIDGATYQLPDNFFVLATQNPIEYEGTYPLPEAQLDRFLFKLNIGYPSTTDELRLMQNQAEELSAIKNVIDEQALLTLKAQVDAVFLDDNVAKYALALVQKTRSHLDIDLGISPRGSIAFVRGAKAYAMTEGRNFVTPDDFQKVLPAVFSHRIHLKGGRRNSRKVAEILRAIMSEVPVPVKK